MMLALRNNLLEDLRRMYKNKVLGSNPFLVGADEHYRPGQEARKLST
jgi:hypothetical protein